MLLAVEDLAVEIGTLRPLDGVSLTVDRGEVVGLVGESGSGKSLTALAIMGLLGRIGGRVAGGAIRLAGTDLTRMPEAGLRALRGRRIGLVTQNPMTALDPLARVGAQIAAAAARHRGLDRRAAARRAVALLADLRIPDADLIARAWPHELSGGMRQRAVIAMALAGEPELIVADEPTTALDVTVQAQILALLADLARTRGLGVLLITHDMGVVAQICDRVVVLYAGRIAEAGPVGAVLTRPRHPYTAALIGCIPKPGQPRGTLTGIAGAVPAVAAYPSGCRFHPRCPVARPPCAATVPALRRADGRLAACHNVTPDADV